jgi:ABC-type transport system substrate-binding protein
VQNFQLLEHLKDYTLIYPPTQSIFEALYFNFHNIVLATHPEVRQAMAMAVDQQTIITRALQGLGTPLCTDHPSAFHPGYEPNAPCPAFELAAANKLLDDKGWTSGPDGVCIKDGQRLEFEYSTTLTYDYWRRDIQPVIQHDFQQIGIKLDIQNYPAVPFFRSFLPREIHLLQREPWLADMTSPSLTTLFTATQMTAACLAAIGSPQLTSTIMHTATLHWTSCLSRNSLRRIQECGSNSSYRSTAFSWHSSHS